MLEACEREFENCQAAIMAAAPADYRPKVKPAGKIKASEVTLQLEKNPDIAATLGARKGGRKLIVFAAETDELLKNAKAKLCSKYADAVVANDVTKEGAGFDSDTNIATIIRADGAVFESGKVSKRQLAALILDKTL